MTAAEYRAILARLRWTQWRAAYHLEIGLRTANGYANGRPIPGTVAKLLRKYNESHPPDADQIVKRRP